MTILAFIVGYFLGSAITLFIILRGIEKLEEIEKDD